MKRKWVVDFNDNTVEGIDAKTIEADRMQIGSAGQLIFGNHIRGDGLSEAMYDDFIIYGPSAWFSVKPIKS